MPGCRTPCTSAKRSKVRAEMFAECDILQPFPQLTRPVFDPAGSDPSHRFVGVTVPTTTVAVPEIRRHLNEMMENVDGIR